MSDYTAHERALIAELEGDDELLRKLFAEWEQGVAEWVARESERREVK